MLEQLARLIVLEDQSGEMCSAKLSIHFLAVFLLLSCVDGIPIPLKFYSGAVTLQKAKDDPHNVIHKANPGTDTDKRWEYIARDLSHAQSYHRKPFDKRERDGDAANWNGNMRNLLWKDGVVYYEIANGFSGKEISLIFTGMDTVESVSCIRFQQRTLEPDYVLIVPQGDFGLGCYSHIGRTGGQQKLSLSWPCFMHGTGAVLHELMHVLGFRHEHQRIDRDHYVAIFWKNVIPDKLNSFLKVFDKEKSDTTLGLPYDLHSIMHYSSRIMAVGHDRPTMLPKDEDSEMGRSDGLSLIDILKINKLYKCDGKDTAKRIQEVRTTTTTTPKCVWCWKSVLWSLFTGAVRGIPIIEDDKATN